jgi:hypothetical protein
MLPKFTGISLAVLFLFQATLLWPVTVEFFTPDGIYYLARQLDDWGDLKSVFTSLDDVDNYRPLTYVVTTKLSSWWELNPFPYHVFTVLAHVGITALVFWLARLLLLSDTAGLAAAVFFGLHGAASRVAFGITFISDLLYAAFFIFAFIAFIKVERGSGSRWRALSLLSFVFALLSKEPAVTLPAVLTAALLLVPGISLQTDVKPLMFRQALRRTLPYWFLSFLYIGWFAFLTCGWFIPQDPAHPYHVSLSWEDLLSKHQYLGWAFNLTRFDTMAGHPSIAALAMRFLPANLAQSFMQLSDFWVYLLGPVWLVWLSIKGEWQSLFDVGINAILTPLIVIAALVFVKGVFRRQHETDDKTLLFGLLFFVFVLLPVLILPADKTKLHNLYVPAAGMGIAVGHFVRVRWRQNSGKFNRVAAVAIPAVFIVAGIHHISFTIQTSWPVTSARAAKSYLADVQKSHPEFPKGAILYFERTGNREWPFLTGAGDLFRVFYMDHTLVTIYGDYEQPPPRGMVFRFREKNGGLFPVQ